MDDNIQKKLQPTFEEASAIVAALPPEQQMALASKIVEEFAAKAQNRTIPDLSHIPLWRGSKIDDQPLAYIEEHYGTRSELLERDIYREDIIGHDPNLIDRASKEAAAKGHTLRYYVPNQSDIVDAVAKPLGFNEEGKAVEGVAAVVDRVQGTMTSRKYRNRNRLAPEGLQAPEKPDISHIPLWGGKVKDGPALEWLGKYYGDYLTTYRANENRLYRQDIQAHDRKLVKGVDREAPKRTRAFLPAKADETDDKAKRFGFDQKGHSVTGPAKEVARTAGAMRVRDHRSRTKKGEDSAAPAAAHS